MNKKLNLLSYKKFSVKLCVIFKGKSYLGGVISIDGAGADPNISIFGRYVKKMAKISSRCVGRHYPTSQEVGWTISPCAT